MPHLIGRPTDPRSVTAIEATPTDGTFFVAPVLAGSRVALLHVSVGRGVSSGWHSHQHESLIYVLRGSLKTVIADQTFILLPGQACLHPENVSHSVEAIEDTIFLEIKSPPPDLSAIFASR